MTRRPARPPHPVACTECRYGVTYWRGDVAVGVCGFCLERWAWAALVLAGPSTS